MAPLVRTKVMSKKMKLLDSGWLTMETRETPMHVASLQLYAVPEDAPDDYFEQMYRKLLDVREVGAPFNKKLRARLPANLDAAWVEDTTLDLEYHVRHSALPRPGRIRELLALVSRLHAQLMDRNRPLWECYLIEGVEGNRFAIYTKMHHSMIDGIAGARLISSRQALAPDQDVPPPWSAEWTKGPSKKRTALARIGAVQTLRNFSRGAGELRDLLRLPIDGHVKTIYRAPKTILNKSVTGARRFAAQSWSLERIKSAGKRHDGTINDVFLAMCSGALRQYLSNFDELPEDPLVAHVPIALRSADEAEEGGNAITAVQVSLATHIADPLERFHAIQASMKAVKDRIGGMKKGEIDAFTTLTNLPLMIGQSTRTAGRSAPMFNLVISNVPGAREKRYVYGAELLATYPVSIVWHGYALNITVNSYLDNLEFGLIACRDTVPKVQRMLDYLEAALVELE